MLPHRHRLDLRHAAPFFTFPHKRHFPTFSVYWRFFGKQIDALPAQAALVVSKKVAPTAVERNQIKRLLRNSLSPLFPSLPTGLQFVITVKRAAIAENTDEVVAQLTKLLNTTSNS